MKPNQKFMLLTAVLLAMMFVSATDYPDFNKDFRKFDRNLYASRHEVTNKEYREFLLALKSSSQKDQYLSCLYDSSQWVIKFPSSYNEPMKDNYHSHCCYDLYPVVNITPEAAKAYCEWLTRRYDGSSRKKFKKVLFRLPSEEEWIKLAAPMPGQDLPWNGNLPYMDNKNKTSLANINNNSMASGKMKTGCNEGLYTMITEHYKPNTLGFYDVIGNVSEMTLEGNQKGGSWDNVLEECKVDKVQKYSLPDPRVGFRVIMEII